MNGKATVLVIDDEADLFEMVRYSLEREGFDVLGAPDGEAGFALAVERRPDVIVLDRMMPGPDGTEVCRRLRRERRTADVPVILLTARSGEEERVRGLDAGADDYVTKPFSPRELVARIRARLRRPSMGGELLPPTVRNGDLVIDADRGEAAFGGRLLQLAPADFRMLQFLAALPGRVMFRRSAEPGSLLLGGLAVREGLVTPDALREALAVQDRNASRKLGEILVERFVLSPPDLDRLLDAQSRAFGGEGEEPDGLLGRLLVARGLATAFPVREALRFQGRLVEAGVKPVPRLGEILVKRGVLSSASLATALRLQSFLHYRCPSCGARIGFQPGTASDACASCGAHVPALLAKIASSLHAVLDEEADAHRVSVPDEVLAAAVDPARLFGRYVLLGLLGRGGSGVVHRAWELDGNRPVALKRLPRAKGRGATVPTPFGDAEEVKRFLTEMRAVAELQHPNIVPILDSGVAEGGFYYTMPVVDGRSLERRLLDGPMSRPEALAVARDLAGAVEAAHRRGICHRDLKPGNVLLDGAGKPWLIDFGVARIARLGDPAYAKGVIIGTPHYMPPEQALGDMEAVDARSDVYSLGALLYEMLSGRSPYEGLSTEAVVSILPMRGPEPIGRVAPALPAGLVRIVERAMERDPAARYRDAGGLVEDLDRYVRGGNDG
jgi:DNA-binding response OmpR family regulator